MFQISKLKLQSFGEKLRKIYRNEEILDSCIYGLENTNSVLGFSREIEANIYTYVFIYKSYIY